LILVFDNAIVIYFLLVLLSLNTQCLTDHDGNDIWYSIDWGDGVTEEWIGPRDSGREITMNHTWYSRGTFQIKVKVKDVFDEESDYATLEVSMPKNKPYINTPFLNFLENHPHLFPLLRQLLNLQ